MNAELAVLPEAQLEPALFQLLARKPAAFNKVTDSRGRPIRCLWKRNNRFYAQMRLPGKKSSAKVPLVDSLGVAARTVTEARSALHELLRQRRNHALPVLTRTPTLAEWIKSYIDWLQKTQTKHPLTIGKEKGTLALWSEKLGTVRLAHLRRSHVNEFIQWRKEREPVSNRTINLDVIALNNCLNHAIQEGRISRLPTETWKPLEHISPRRPLWTFEQIELVCAKALEVGENGDLLSDYIRFMAFSGTRRNEALNVAWTDVDWTRRTVTIRRTKYGGQRDIDFNARLEALLREMQLRKLPGTAWLFPSPKSGAERDERAKSLQGSLETAREAAGLPGFCFHDLRHYFISTCVMAGIDYMTIARWVGHKDGGVLIGRVYGHLDDEHAKKMASRIFAADSEVTISHQY